MFYMISYTTKQILRDENGKPLLSRLNDSPEISDALKKHGPLWLEFINTKSYSIPPKAALTQEDLLYIQTICPVTPQQPEVASVDNSSGGLFDFM